MAPALRPASLLAAALALIACGSGGHESLKAPPADSLATVLSKAESVALVEVLQIEGPFWNSRDGGPWDGWVSEVEGVPGLRPIQFSRVHVHVREPLLGEALPERVALLVFGDANTRWEGAENPPSHVSSSGGFAGGTTFVVALSRQEFRFEDRTETAWSTARGWEGNWRIDGDQAVGSYTGWSMPLGELREALRVAWAARQAAG